MGHVVVTNEPAEILLKDAISEPIAEFIDQRIQTRFGGIGLPTTIKHSQRSVINHGNLVTVEIHSRQAIIGHDFSVARLPALVSVDCGVHLRFDLTQGCLLWLMWLVLHPRGGCGSNGGQLCNCPLSHLFIDGAPVQRVAFVALQAVVVDPLTQRPIATHQQGDDGTTGCFHGILSQRGAEPADKHLTRQRVDLQSPDAGGAVAVDVDHVVF